MSESPRYMVVVCSFDPAKPDDFKHYVSHARPIFAANGGRPVGQYATEATLVGDGQTAFVIVMAFPSEAAIRAVFADPAYQALIPARTAVFPQLQILICKDFDPSALLAVAQ